MRDLNTELITILQQVLGLGRPSYACRGTGEDNGSRLEGCSLGEERDDLGYGEDQITKRNTT